MPDRLTLGCLRQQPHVLIMHRANFFPCRLDTRHHPRPPSVFRIFDHPLPPQLLVNPLNPSRFFRMGFAMSLSLTVGITVVTIAIVIIIIGGRPPSKRCMKHHSKVVDDTRE